MILSKRNQGKFATWLRTEVPRLKHDPGVIDTYMELTGVMRQDIMQALEWGRAPTLKIVAGLKCNGDASGCYRKAHPHQIEVEENLVTRYENGTEAKVLTTDKGTVVPLVGATVLHELVHWADYRVNGTRTNVASFYHDIGSKWEWIVFSEMTAQGLRR